MNKIARRDFLKKLGGLILAGSAASLAGCARLLDWSSKRQDAQKKTIKNLKKSETKTEKPSQPKTSYPNLVIVEGGEPEQNVRKALEKLGGANRFVNKGAKVVLKPNILTAQESKYAATTNPQLMAALVTICKEAGASQVVVFDRPVSSSKTAYEISGIDDAVKRAGGTMKVLTDRNFENTVIPQGRLLKKWPLLKDIFEADVFINVPIAKDHSLAGLTMAMKNLMGIMGGFRSVMHTDFAQKIVDLNTLVKPHLVVLDAHKILVRNGPTGGNLADVETKKTIIVGTNQVSIDAYGTTLFGMKPTDLKYLRVAQEQGLGEINLDKIKIVKETII